MDDGTLKYDETSDIGEATTGGTVNINNYNTVVNGNGITTIGDGTSVSNNNTSTDEIRGADVVEKVSQFVREDYKDNYGSIKPYPWGAKMRIDKLFFNVDLTCDNYCCENHAGPTAMYRIFENPEGPCSRVILCGRQGIGKTTLCQKYVYDWATGKTNTYKASFPQFKVVVFLRLYEVKGSTLRDIMEQDVFFNRLNAEEKTQYFDYMLKHPKEFLFILDGVNECNLNELSGIKLLLEDRLLKGVYLIATSRPVREADLMELQNDHFHACYYVKGFSVANVLGYICTYLMKDPEKCKFLMEEIQANYNLMHLGRIPLLTPIICELSKMLDHKLQWPTLPTSTELLTHYVKVVCGMFVKKRNMKVEEDIEEKLGCLGRLALDGVISNSMQYTTNKLDEFNVDKATRELGFLNAEPALSTALKRDPQLYCFAHKSIHEFLAARWLFAKWDSEKSQAIVAMMLKDSSKYFSILVFICGLLSKNLDRLSKFMQELSGDVFEKGCYSNRMQLVLECCYEARQGNGSFITQQISKTPKNCLFTKVETNCGFTLRMSFREVQGLSLMMPLLHLTTLDLSDILIQTREAKLLATSCLENNHSLTAVKFSNCFLNPDAVEAICLSLKELPNLKHVDFSCCNLSDKGMREVANLMSSRDGLSHDSITNLRLGNHPATTTNPTRINIIGPSVFFALGNPRDSQRVDDASSTDSSQSVPKQIMRKLWAFQRQLDSSPHTDEAIMELIKAARNNKCLREVSLLCCHIGNLTQEWLAVFKENEETLKKIRIQLRNLDDKLYNELVKFENDMPKDQEIKIIFKEDGSNPNKLPDNIGCKIKLTPSNYTKTLRREQSRDHIIFDSFFTEQLQTNTKSV